MKAYITVIWFYIHTVSACPSTCSCQDGGFYANCASQNLEYFPDPNSFSLKSGTIILNYNKIQGLTFNVSSKQYLLVQKLEIKRNVVTQFDLRAIAMQYPNLKHLDLWNNKINLISQKYVRSLNQLEILDLSYNIIVLIESDTLKHFPSLVSLDLEGNRLRTIKENVFDGLQSLKSLNLASNQIEVIHMNWFKTTGNIKNINLRKNMIFLWFPHDSNWPMNIHQIDLSHNRLKMMPPFPKFENLQNYTRHTKLLNVLGNPLYCGCRPEGHTYKKEDDVCQVWFECASSQLSDMIFKKTDIDDRGFCNKTLYLEWMEYFTKLPVCRKPESDYFVNHFPDNTVYVCYGSGFPVPVVKISNGNGLILAEGNQTVVYKTINRNLSELRCSARSQIGEDRILMNFVTVSDVGIKTDITDIDIASSNRRRTKWVIIVIAVVCAVMVLLLISTMLLIYKIKNNASSGLRQNNSGYSLECEGNENHTTSELTVNNEGANETSNHSNTESLEEVYEEPQPHYEIPETHKQSENKT